MSRSSDMTKEELHSIIKEVYGDRQQRRFAKDIGKGEVTISRWMTGHSPIEDNEALLIRLLLILHRRKLDWRKWLKGYTPAPVSVDDIM